MISSNDYQCNNCVSCDMVQVTAEGDFSSAVIYTEIIRMVQEAALKRSQYNSHINVIGSTIYLLLLLEQALNRQHLPFYREWLNDRF